jgi:hypothetical protein
MKRSEMVDKIYNYMLYETGDVHDTTHAHNCKIDAEAIMKLLEKAGMQPPNTTLDKMIPGSGLKEDNPHYYACWDPEGPDHGEKEG